MTDPVRPAPSLPARLLLRLRQNWRSHLMSLALFVALVAGFGAWQTRHLPSGPAPALAGPLVDGRELTLAQWRAAHPGRAVALHVWAEWCGICRMEEHSVSRVAADHPVLTIAMRSGPGPAVARTLAQRGLDWPVIVDADGAIARAWRVPAVPTFIVIDPQGQVRSASVGYTTELGMRLRLWWAGWWRA
ncbi:MAG: protein disulfide oxidoreductase [Comamonadaceae bacterium]|nr:protein disulfide oxidoreductase [Comamonadaceae bacterium]